MEFYRWILILTGVVLLVVAYLMGSKRTSKRGARQVAPAGYDPSIDELSVPVDDPLYDNSLAGNTGTRGHTVLTDEQLDESLDEVDSDGRVEPVYASSAASDDYDEVDLALDGHPVDHGSGDHRLGDRGLGDYSASQYSQGDYSQGKSQGKITSFSDAVSAASALENTDAVNEHGSETDNDQGFAGEFEIYHEPLRFDEFDEKLVSIHVVAASGRRFYGNDLKSLFDKHGYSHGRMSLYHCSLDGDNVFSVANMVKPGTFDESQMRTFETPGITLFMRLPIKLDSDVAFDFLIREAKELAEELDGQLRDGDRNPLSEQTIQHMREDMQQYVFRTKQALQPAT